MQTATNLAERFNLSHPALLLQLRGKLSPSEVFMFKNTVLVLATKCSAAVLWTRKTWQQIHQMKEKNHRRISADQVPYF
jgi:hypothetical protein